MNTTIKINKLEKVNKNPDLTAIATFLPGIILVQPRVYVDTGGFFLEAYVKEKYEKIGIQDTFVQDNQFFFYKRDTKRASLSGGREASQTGKRNTGGSV